MRKEIHRYFKRLFNATSQFGNALIGFLFNLMLMLEFLRVDWVLSWDWMPRLKVYLADGFYDLYRYGFPDESISSVTYKNHKRAKAFYWLHWLLEALDPGHGERAVEWEEGRKFKKP